MKAEFPGKVLPAHSAHFLSSSRKRRTASSGRGYSRPFHGGLLDRLQRVRLFYRVEGAAKERAAKLTTDGVWSGSEVRKIGNGGGLFLIP
jgi:hypothetical protein